MNEIAAPPVRRRHVSFCPLPQSDLFQLQAPVPPGGDVDLSPRGLQSFIDARVPQAGLAVLGVAWASAYSMFVGAGKMTLRMSF